MATINISQLANEINRELQRYANRITDETDVVAKEVAEDGVRQLKVTSPKDKGDYAAGWTYKKVKDAYVVHNKDEYRLTHLLEKPHVQRDGSLSQAQPHIKPVEQKMIADFERKVYGVISE
ncbi:HK97 gp10 family phage protein [Caryophanon tenue]|uniref:HK97 gp10 family phage protein n=1 Tax=Caryophanon tenue TaxID=33978 RepID=A0A1C0Y523_9BACL|nr:HK97 gp10 family phage protein [Caryophanon tenue]OCS82277.1 hypothetical protein A6M13_07535 [Caryophanon tenue]